MLTLANSPAEIVRQLLIDLSQGTDPAPWASGVGNPWPVFATNEPSTPDDCITVKDTAGQMDGESQLDGEVFYHYGFQVRVRSVDHPTGWLKASTIRTQMATNCYGRTEVVGSNSYLVWCIAKVGEVLPLGKETPHSKRSLFTINALIAFG